MSSSTAPTFTRGALNDTSLAAVLTSDGNRHLFLQDINGTLRHAVFSSVENLWLSNVDYLLPDDTFSPPRLGTPITTIYPSAINNDFETILVYYVNVENTLSLIYYDTSAGKVDSSDILNRSIAIEPNSRYSLGEVIDETLQLSDIGIPQSRYPFSRLAWLNSNTSSLHIYHQISEGVLAEEENIAGAGWTICLIDVLIS